MKREEVVRDLKNRFKSDIVDYFEKSSKRAYVEIKPEAIVRVATYMYRALGARFCIASGVDVRSHMEILYHFLMEDTNYLISFRVKLDKSNLEIDSLTSVFEAANWIEREIREMLGINFKGHPNLKRLLLSDEWPEGVYPLRCDYKEWDEKAIRDRGL